MKLYSPLRARNVREMQLVDLQLAACASIRKIHFESTVECPNSLNHSRCATRLLPQKEKKKSWLISAVQVRAIAIKKKKKEKKRKEKRRRRRGRKFPARCNVQSFFILSSLFPPVLSSDSSLISRSEILFSNESISARRGGMAGKRMRHGSVD